MALKLTSPRPYVALMLTSPGRYVIFAWQAKKVADREEQAVQVAAMAAARQAERSFELKAKDLKAKTDETLKKERSQQRHEIHNALAEAEAERERIRYEGMETVEVARREAAEQVREGVSQ